MRILIALCCLLALVSCGAAAASAAGSSSAPEAGAAPQSVASLHWMSGHWAATIEGVQMEEVWTAPDGGMLVGLHRDVKKGRAHFEFMRIAETKDGVVFFAQPGGQPPTPFRLTQSGETRVVFEKPDHDYPKRIIYWLQDGRLCARTDDGAGNNVDEWCWAKR